jgi:hypothetical protein
MATVTPNFNFPVPQSTDLVKDGATAIAALGTSVDTQFVDLKGGTTGQVLAKASNTDLDYSWVTTDDANAIQNAIVDAKGDLIAASAADTPARLAVGANGETLVADSSATTGLRYQANFAAGKNKIINGDFAINQRNFTSITTDLFGFDRWQLALSGATVTYTPQTFTPGAAPVAGYEASNFARIAVTTGNDQCRIQQHIEDVRTFAGQTATVSFWAKGTNPTTAGNLTVALMQNFGTGGSPSAQALGTQQTFVLTANWTRYSLTFSVPSLTGKTLGTTPNTSFLGVWIGQGTSVSTDAWTLDIWGVQIEAGSVATAFQTATGTIQGELAACQRYYERRTATDAFNTFAAGSGQSTTAAWLNVNTKVTLRTAPTSIDFSTLAIADGTNAAIAVTALVVQGTTNGTNSFNLVATVAASGVQYRPYYLLANNSSSAYVGWSAEL